MPNEEKAVETKRVEFWVSADVPKDFGDEKLSQIASSLADAALSLVAPGAAVEHGYEIFEAELAGAEDAEDTWHGGP
jgi:hypothetical protein